MSESSQDCGTCIACCYALSFNAEEGLKKKAGDMCPNCTGTGCRIYETRFRLCREFLCAWKHLPQLDEAWRPDKSGVMMIEVLPHEMPETWRHANVGIEFLILTDERAVMRPGFADYVRTLVSRKVPVFMSIIGGPKTVMNQYLEALAAADDVPGLTKMLVHMYGLHLEARKQGIQAPETKKEQPDSAA